MVLTAGDVVVRAARDGLVLSHALVAEALASADRVAIASRERARYEVLVWDGSDPCPVGTAERWTHGKDANSRHAIEAFRAGGVVYFVLRDGELLLWQPFSPHTGRAGRYLTRESVGAAAERHLSEHVDGEVDRMHYQATVDAALALHQQRGTPYHTAVTER